MVTALLLMHLAARLLGTGGGVLALTALVGAVLIGAALWAARTVRHSQSR
jgi:hypothetical protein